MRIPSKLKKATSLEPKTLPERGLKLAEETGELAAEIFKYLGKKKTKKSKLQTLASLKEEAVDCLIMSLDILVKVGATDKEITELLDKKVDKWLHKMEG